MIYAGAPLRVKELAAEFQVSERTIKYDLETIRLWLERQGIELQSKPNKGIWIEGDDSLRIRLLEKLDEPDGHSFLNQQERVRNLTLDLLLLDAPIPIGELARRSEVSRNTMLSDLAIVEQFFDNWAVLLERTRSGIAVAASEMLRRAVLEHVVHDFLTSADMLQIVQCVVKERHDALRLDESVRRFLQRIPEPKAIFRAIRELVRTTEQEYGVLLSDRVMIGILIRLCIVYLRHHQAAEMHSRPSVQAMRAGHNSLFRTFRQAITPLAECWQLAVSDEEIWYVCLQAVGTASPNANGGQPEPPAEQRMPDAFAVTKQLIELVSRGMRTDFQKDHRLLNNLLAHIGDKLMKISYGVVEPNPLLHDIIRNYRPMFEQVKLACRTVFGSYGIELGDPDIAFIVLHFQTAYERREEGKYKALAVCGTGRGTSSLLKTVVENEIKSVQVAAFCSVMEIDKALQAAPYDLVISLFPIAAPIPVVVVKPLPGRTDFQAIQEELDRIGSVPSSADEAAAHDLQRWNDDSVPLQQTVQEIVYQGYELSRAVVTRFRDQLTEERAEGLTLHLLLMMNRIAFDAQYTYEEAGTLDEDAHSREARAALQDIFSTRQLQVTESELKAILRYIE
jgi:transcriptional antiterminator